MEIHIIAAMGKQRQIGGDGGMLWHIREDFQHFKKTTGQHTLIMGRKTYQSIGRPLPGRTTLVLTQNPHYEINHPNVFIAHSKEKALQKARERGESKVFICGGEQIYAQFLMDASTLYLSRVNFEGKADSFFPPFEHLPWKLVSKRSFTETTQSPSWSLEVWLRADFP